MLNYFYCSLTQFNLHSLDKKYGKTFNQLFSLRLTGDYEDRHILDMETEVLPLVEPAKELIDLVSEMAKKQLM